ncbi:hypothetical protein ACRRTK_006077 [Alexandromys fortis]
MQKNERQYAFICMLANKNSVLPPISAVETSSVTFQKEKLQEQHSLHTHSRVFCISLSSQCCKEGALPRGPSCLCSGASWFPILKHSHKHPYPNSHTCINTLRRNRRHGSDNKRYPTGHTYNYCKYGIHHRKCGKCIHSTGEHRGLGEEKKDLFGGSDPHCSGHLQNCFFVFIGHNFVGSITGPSCDDSENSLKKAYYFLDASSTECKSTGTLLPTHKPERCHSAAAVGTSVLLFSEVAMVTLLDNETYMNQHRNSNGNHRKWIHSTGEYHGLGQERKYLFGRSDPYCSCLFQTQSFVVHAHFYVVIHTVPTFVHGFRYVYEIILGGSLTYMEKIFALSSCSLGGTESKRLETYKCDYRNQDILLWTMDIAIQSICAATIIAEFIIGSAANGLIVLVNITDWVKRRKISSVDQIITALAISRINMLWFTFIITLISSLYPDLEMTVKMTMNAAVQVISVTILNVEFITGNLGNGFIALVNIMDWVKRRKISSVDQILTALAISRITLLWSLYIMASTFSLYPDAEVTMKTDNERCFTRDICNYTQCGVHNCEFLEWIHNSGEHHGLGQKKKDLFSGSDPDCSSHLQNQCAVVTVLNEINIFNLLTLKSDYENNNEYCCTGDICNNAQCGVLNWEFGEWIHSTDEHYGLGQEKKDLFSGSDPHCSGHLQDHCDVDSIHNCINIFNVP